MSAANFPQFSFDATSGKFVSDYPKPGLAQTDPAYMYASSAIGDALRPGPDRRDMYKLLGTLLPGLLSAQGGISATNPQAGLGAINPLAAQQMMRPGTIPRQPLPPVGGAI